MEIRTREQQQPFTTKDGSTIRSLLDLSNAPVVNQSLAEATLPPGAQSQRHYFGSVQESREEAPMRISFAHVPDVDVEHD